MLYIKCSQKCTASKFARPMPPNKYVFARCAHDGNALTVWLCALSVCATFPRRFWWWPLSCWPSSGRISRPFARPIAPTSAALPSCYPAGRRARARIVCSERVRREKTVKGRRAGYDTTDRTTTTTTGARISLRVETVPAARRTNATPTHGPDGIARTSGSDIVRYHPGRSVKEKE